MHACVQNKTKQYKTDTIQYNKMQQIRHTCMQTYRHTYMRACIHTYLGTYILTYLIILTCLHTYMLTGIHTYMHTYLNVYLPTVEQHQPPKFFSKCEEFQGYQLHSLRRAVADESPRSGGSTRETPGTLVQVPELYRCVEVLSEFHGLFQLIVMF